MHELECNSQWTEDVLDRTTDIVMQAWFADRSIEKPKALPPKKLKK